MSWQPSAAAYRAGLSYRGQYVGGSAFAEGDPLQLAPIAAGVELARWIHANFAGVSLVGLRRGALVQHPLRDAAGNLRRRDAHEEGRALDVMVGTRAAGNAVADWAVVHARELGIQRVIWDHVRWRLSETTDAWQQYTGPNPHTDHVHIELLPLGWSREQMRTTLAAVAAGVGAPAGDLDLLVLPAVSSGVVSPVVLVPVAIVGFLTWLASQR